MDNAPLADLELIVRRWHDRAEPNIGTKPFEESWFDFLEGRGNVRYAVGQGPIDRAFAAAVAATVPSVAMRFDQQELRLLVSFCRELQRAAGAEPFYLACRSAGRLLNVNHTTVWRWLRGLCRDGILEFVRAGDRKQRRANTYRYIGGD